MSSVNKVILIGNLGRDPEVRYTPEGSAVCTISLATTSSWKDRDSGERRESTEWHRVIFFNRLAEIAGEYLKKGRQIYVEGQLKTRKWQDKDGQDRYVTEVIAGQMQMLGGRGEDEMPSEAERPSEPSREAQAKSYRDAREGREANPSRGGDFADFDDDIPF